MPCRLSIRTAATALVAVAVAAVAASPAAASAGPLVVSSPSCDDQVISKTFMPWLDPADYVPMPDGGFESGGAGWFMNGAATIADGNESFQVGGATDSRSLSLQANSSAISPTICVGLDHPTIRFFVRRRSTGPLESLSRLRVDALVELGGGAILPVTIGTVTNVGSWQPTLPMPIVANLLPLLPGDHTPVTFRFTAQTGDWSIDDVWVDPYGRR